MLATHGLTSNVPFDPRGTALQGIGLLKEQGVVTQSRLADCCTWRIFKAKEEIIDQESDSRDVFFVVDGKVRVFNAASTGREVYLDELESGAFFGELSALDGRPRSANVVALQESLVASLSQDRFTSLIQREPQVALGVMRRLARVVRDADARIMNLTTLAAKNRIHAELLRLAREGIVEGGRAVITPAPLHADIANRVSTVRETVTRALRELEQNGVIVRRHDALMVPDLARLADMVQRVQGA